MNNSLTEELRAALTVLENSPVTEEDRIAILKRKASKEISKHLDSHLREAMAALKIGHNEHKTMYPVMFMDIPFILSFAVSYTTGSKFTVGVSFTSVGAESSDLKDCINEILREAISTVCPSPDWTIGDTSFGPLLSISTTVVLN